VEKTRLKRSPLLASRSIVGVGITPPNVLGTPKPASSVMIKRMLGAPFGGTIRGAHHDFDSIALSLITPPNSGAGAGSCLPSMVVVAPGVPAAPVVCWAKHGAASDNVVVVAKIACMAKLRVAVM